MQSGKIDLLLNHYLEDITMLYREDMMAETCFL